VAISLFGTSLAVARQSEPPANKKEVPAGAEAAVKTSLASRPGALLEEVVTPSSAIGLGGPSDPLWTIRLRIDGTLETLHVSADGVILKRSRPVESKDLPSLVQGGVAKVAPKGVARMTKLETLGVVRYVELPSPQRSYVSRVRHAESTTIVTVAADGTILERKDATGPGKERKVDPKARAENRPIPEPAARAVEAMRKVFPNMVFDLVEEVPYLDSSTQTLSMVWYEVEFWVDGVKHEFNATPDGVVIAFEKRIAPAELPACVSQALAQAVPHGSIEEVILSETRAGPRVVALAEPVVVYEIEPKGDGDAALDAIKLRIDGTVVQEPELPDWARPKSKRGTH
jgi:hypothetical protein